MIDFEAEFPEIAQKYFDLKFENENIYIKQYGYGRKYANKPECGNCKQKGNCIEKLINDKNDNELLKLYFTKEIDLLCLSYENAECRMPIDNAASYLMSLIERTDIDQIINLLKSDCEREEVTQENIPQYSQLDDAFYKVPNILMHFKEQITFKDLGYYLEQDDNADSKTEAALKKYGENHTKLACLLDLAHISKNGVKSDIFVTKFGELYNKLEDTKKREFALKLCLRIPIIQNRFIENKEIDTVSRDLEILSKETQKRRGSNVINMIKSIMEYSTNYSENDFNL